LEGQKNYLVTMTDPDQWLKEIENDPLFDHLLHQIKEGKVIAFIGAGFSRPAG